MHDKSMNRYMMHCAIWHHLYNLKNLKNTHGEALLLVKFPATLLKISLLHGCFSCFLNCNKGIKSGKMSHMMIKLRVSYFHTDENNIKKQTYRMWSNLSKSSNVVNWCEIFWCFFTSLQVNKSFLLLTGNSSA